MQGTIIVETTEKRQKKGKEKKDDKNKTQKMRSWHHKKTNHK